MDRWLTLQRPSIIPIPKRPAGLRWGLFAGLMAGIWLTMALYTNTLSLPFFEDDYSHIRWLSGLSSPFAPFITAAGLPAYRPLGETLLKIWYLLLGRHDPAWLRYLNISMHALNVALVAALTLRLDRSRQRYLTAGLAAMLFGTFPFAYQAIPWINVFFYPLNNLLQLSMVLFYWEARVRSSRRLLGLALFLCFLSPFEIEYGLLSCTLLLAVEIALWLQGRQKKVWLGGPLLGLALNVVFLVIRAYVPRATYGFGSPTPERLFQISVYLLQGLTYPVAPTAVPLMNRFGLSDMAAIAAVGLPILVAIVVFLLRRGQRALLVFSLLWFAVLQLPGLITLNFAYYINSPRLLYPSSPATSWIWAAFFTAWLLPGRRQVLRATAVGLGVLAILLVNVDFIRIRTDHYHLAESSIHQLAEIARDTKRDEELLVVNMPSWINPQERTYALGNNGIQLIPFYVGIGDVVFAANDEDQPMRAVQFHNIRQPQPYYYGMYGPRMGWEETRLNLAETDEVYLAIYSPQEVNLIPAGKAGGLPWYDGDPETSFFGDNIDLLIGDYEVDGDALNLTLNWRVSGSVDADLIVFVHLYGPDGQLIDQDDGYPLRGLSPFWLWDEVQILEDRRNLTWPAGASTGVYTIGVGVYDQATGQRLPATSAGGDPLPNNTAILLSLERS